MTWDIIHGDCLDLLRGVIVVHAEPYHHIAYLDLPDNSIHCVVTSPPYWALRDYGVEGQLGLEPTPEEYIAKMVNVFREVKRVLRDDGVLWLNIGDCYADDTKWGGSTGGKHADALHGSPTVRKKRSSNLTPKNLVGIPWRLAFALQSDGWILRRDNIWSKPNPMPESVNGWRWERCRIRISKEDQSLRTEAERLSGFGRHSGNTLLNPTTWVDCPGCDKCAPNGGLVLRRGSGRSTTAHEYLFQFTKTGEYFYDCEAVKEESVTGDTRKPYGPGQIDNRGNGHDRGGGAQRSNCDGLSRNRRSVWEIATQPYPGAHFATFPETLVEPCVKAGTSEKGCCASCGAPWARILEPSDEAKERLGAAWHNHENDLGRGQRGTPPALKGPANITKGWRATCSCNAGDPVPCAVADPFAGSGTVASVAVKLKRHFVGVELNAEYAKLAAIRIARAKEQQGCATAEDAEVIGKTTQLGLLK